MQAIVLKSNIDTRFHFGESLGAYTEEQSNSTKTTSDYLHSDTLWSALVNAWVLCKPETLVEFIKECENGNFILSSAFYCIEYKGDNIFFLPKPASLNLFDYCKPKKLKKIKFISKGVWETGLLPDDWFRPEKCTLLQNESIVALKSEIDKEINLFRIETMPHTRARDISDREDAFYYQSDLYLLSGDTYKVYWYFLVDNKLPDKMQIDLSNALQTLVNLGIGGERTSGCGGLTEFINQNFEFRNENSTHFASVSLIAPEENELFDASQYQVIKRGGRFLEKGKSLPMIHMFLEGAIFDREITGRIVKLNENPPILRYGKSLCIPLNNNYIL